MRRARPACPSPTTDYSPGVLVQWARAIWDRLSRTKRFLFFSPAHAIGALQRPQKQACVHSNRCTCPWPVLHGERSPSHKHTKAPQTYSMQQRASTEPHHESLPHRSKKNTNNFRSRTRAIQFLSLFCARNIWGDLKTKTNPKAKQSIKRTTMKIRPSRSRKSDFGGFTSHYYNVYIYTRPSAGPALGSTELFPTLISVSTSFCASLTKINCLVGRSETPESTHAARSS